MVATTVELSKPPTLVCFSTFIMELGLCLHLIIRFFVQICVLRHFALHGRSLCGGPFHLKERQHILRSLCHQVRDSMYRALSYSARLDQPAAGKVLETANGGCLVDQKSGTENYKWSVRGKGMETWPKAFSKYHF